jgi:hypothetical protein
MKDVESCKRTWDEIHTSDLDAYLEAPIVHLPIERLEVVVIKMLIQYNTDEQLPVLDLPTPSVR